jgi:hypothetical protein
MLVEIKQKTGSEDKTPEKEALINKANILDALHKEWMDEDFEIKIIDSRPIEKLIKSWERKPNFLPDLDLTAEEKAVYHSYKKMQGKK